ncbi:hypothetical protein chiPu_0019894 [Chiloscyllium punctatum]|uniref:MHC class II beta chain N-terminal domain-containing protein n=1 Tax=Chiloscyllium punctatum TaxID=137246 RepID=A0A401RTF1_CHIPU|nr:hypothetical protein [Chiloscyllium punctatum]
MGMPDLGKYVYDKELIAYYDFDQKIYVAAKDWAKGNVDRWNKEEAAGTYQEGIRVCENNVPIYSRVVSRKEVQNVSLSERHKIIVGALFFGIGLIILLAGVIMRLKNAKAILDSSNHGPRLMGPAVS